MIYFRGCVVREKTPRIGMATKKILEKADVDYRILDNEECCGSVLLRTGFTDEAREVMAKTAEKLDGEQILVSCAGCYNTLKNDYKEILGAELDVIHTSQLFKKLLKEGMLSPKNLPITVCYHDPCHLGRQCSEYESPRAVLNQIAELVEMENIMENSRCCGSGGGVKSAYPELANNLAGKRLDDAHRTQADILVTTCSFCLINLQEARERPVGTLPVLDLSEILLWALIE
jgi:heterodisulfide reductase subunit D